MNPDVKYVTRPNRNFHETSLDSHTVLHASDPGIWTDVVAKQATHQLRQLNVTLEMPVLVLHATNGSPWTVQHGRHTYQSPASAGSVDIFPAGMPYHLAFDGQLQQNFFLWLSPDLLRRVAEEGRYPTPEVELLNQVDARDPVLQHLVRTFEAELQTGCQGGRLLGESLAMALAAHLVTRYATFPVSLPAENGGLSPLDLRRVEEFIQDRLSSPLTVAEIAACVHLSPFHFSRRFRLSTGMSPHQYVVAQRVEAAKRLLLRRENSLAEIARQVGFADQSHFTRHFRRAFGVSPGAFLGSSASSNPTPPAASSSRLLIGQE